MPFLRALEGEGDFDEGEVDSAPSPLPGETAYMTPEEYRFGEVAEEMEDSSVNVRDALRSAGATRFRVLYDGGCDEGFSRPDGFWFGPEWRDVDQTADYLARPEVAAKFPPGNSIGGCTRRDIKAAIDELADDLAARLLGRGFGTGEYEMYGAFDVDLETLEMTDDPSATPPSGMI